MSKFDVIEIPFEGEEFEQSLEDKFLLAKVRQEINNVTDLEEMKKGAIKLLELAVMRQTFIRGLVKRLANLEGNAIRTRYEE
jgi:hypothetical protein